MVYEITAEVDEDLIGDYEKYMIEQHIPDVLATGFFTSGDISRNGSRYRIRYIAASRRQLDEYIRDHSERLRADFSRHFPAGITLSRNIWKVLSTFSSLIS